MVNCGMRQQRTFSATMIATSAGCGEDAPAGCSDLFEQLNQLALYTAVGGERGKTASGRRSSARQFRNGLLRTWKTLIAAIFGETPVVGELLTRLAGKIRDPRKGNIKVRHQSILRWKIWLRHLRMAGRLRNRRIMFGIGSPRPAQPGGPALLLSTRKWRPTAPGEKSYTGEHFQHTGMTQRRLNKTDLPSPARQAICGEFSPTHLAYPHCIEHLATALPRNKIIVILRNPVDRASFREPPQGVHAGIACLKT